MNYYDIKDNDVFQCIEKLILSFIKKNKKYKEQNITIYSSLIVLGIGQKELQKLGQYLTKVFFKPVEFLEVHDFLVVEDVIINAYKIIQLNSFK